MDEFSEDVKIPKGFKLKPCETNGMLNGKVAIITGGGTGVGFESAKKLAQKGARVVIASRNQTKLKIAQDDIIDQTGNRDVTYRLLDLSSLKSVRNFATQTMLFEKRVDILVNNAVAFALPDTLTEDGLNLTMQVNYYGAFLLTFLLLPFLKASAPSRIINSSVALAALGDFDFEHWNDPGVYDNMAILANSKLADTLFTAELHRRLRGTGVAAITYDPFVVSDSTVLQLKPSTLHTAWKHYNPRVLVKEIAGAQVAYYAAEPTVQKESGSHFKLCHKWISLLTAKNANLTSSLWAASKKAVKITKLEDWEDVSRNTSKNP
ncbi:retinol dehydrogenase 11-like [Pectinophora gossypiella]|uniref:retinol dehydrogenase 11-like n=1 Tax=Pectinophora gossypiella TaxID=13191 RepID=UPI00214F4A69|nr:retinol dehydrogenase 11-like [Pectinophora gossypiella]